MSKSKAPSQRQLRVGELIRHALTQVLSREDTNDPVLADKVISVTEVRVSPDLKIATCFISPLGGLKGTDNVDDICTALNKRSKFLRGKAVPHLNQLKYMPQFRFRPDTSFDNFSRIDALLRSDVVQRDTRSGDTNYEDEE